LWRQRYKIAPAIDLLPKEPDDQQKNYGADDSVYDGRKNAANENEPDQRKQPTCNHRTDDADHDVAYQSKAVPMNSGIAGDLAGAPQSQVVGAVLGTCNHPELREEVLNGVITMAREIWPILIEEMINAGRCEEDWH
jgi:hypothetical protein